MIWDGWVVVVVVAPGTDPQVFVEPSPPRLPKEVHVMVQRGWRSLERRGSLGS